MLLICWQLPTLSSPGERKERAIGILAVQPWASIEYEYEKRSYPVAIAQVLRGNPAGTATLTQLDPQSLTLGIDLFSGFTLKA